MAESNKNRGGNTGAIREESSLTLNEMLRYGGLIFTIVSASVSLVWYIANIKADISDMKKDLLTYKEISNAKEINNERTVNELRGKMDKSEEALQKVSEKLEVTVSILNRIDKKVGNP